MNEDTVKSLLIRDKQFLRNIYSGPNILKNKRILMSSSDNEINTLLKYLFCVTNGVILINSENFEKIKKGKKLSILRQYFEKRSDFLNILKGQRERKIELILKLTPVLPYILYGLFNLEPKLRIQKNGI